MKINNVEINEKQFAYDGCHKIYIIEDDEDLKTAKKCGYSIYDISQLENIYNNSCELRFINNWKLTKTFVGQYENAKFENFPKVEKKEENKTYTIVEINGNKYIKEILIESEHARSLLGLTLEKVESL